MHQIRRRVEHFDNKGGADQQEAGHQDDEDRGPVAGIGEAVIEAANLAAIGQGEIAGEQSAAAAGRAAPYDAAPQGGAEGGGVLIRLRFAHANMPRLERNPFTSDRDFASQAFVFDARSYPKSR